MKYHQVPIFQKSLLKPHQELSRGTMRYFGTHLKLKSPKIVSFPTITA